MLDHLTCICSQNSGFSCYSGWTGQGYPSTCVLKSTSSLSKICCSNSFITGSFCLTSAFFPPIFKQNHKKHFQGSVFLFSSHPVSPKLFRPNSLPVVFLQFQRYSPSSPPNYPLHSPANSSSSESNGHSSVLILLTLSLVFSSFVETFFHMILVSFLSATSQLVLLVSPDLPDLYVLEQPST